MRLINTPKRIPFSPKKYPKKIEREIFIIASDIGAHISLNKPAA